MITDINSEDRLVQATFADHLSGELGWDSVYAWNEETFGPAGTLGRASEREVVLLRDVRAALKRLNPGLPESVREAALEKLMKVDYSRSLLQHNREFYGYIQNGVPVEWRDAGGVKHYAQAQVIDFKNGSTNGAPHNKFLAVRELKIQGLRVPHYNRRADLVCYVNGLPLVFVELKAVYRNIRQGFDNNLTDYMTEQVIPHAFHHNAFLVVSNGDQARYGSITSKWDHFIEWKRNDEKDKGRVDAETLLNGMLEPERLLDLVENFILYDDSRPGGTRKIIARNHQVLGVNNAVASVVRQEILKNEFPPDKRLISYTIPRPLTRIAASDNFEKRTLTAADRKAELLPLIKRAHPDLGRLGVFWHTQGSGKSYSMAFFVEKVRRSVPGNFTFLVMTDREDLDDQLWRTFIGCGVTDEKTPRAGSGKELREMLKENPRFVFSLIHKFNQIVKAPYSKRDDIIVLSDEAHRTQAGKFAVNMRMALPNAAFIGFTGTPLLTDDHLTRRIFGGYVSRYDFKRSEEDNATVKLVYENRGEKLGLARQDLNKRIAEKIEQAELDYSEKTRLEKLLGKDYEIITADDRLDKLADDFVEHCTTRWESGKSMMVCIDKLTCGRMLQSIKPRWLVKLAKEKALLPLKEAELAAARSEFMREILCGQLEKLQAKVRWMETTIIEIVISEAQNEVKDFAKWGIDIVPHREIMKRGFETGDGKKVPVDDAFKNPDHPFRIAIVCAMWLTGFDVECLSTMYIDKPMKAHTLMQAIARANRVYPGKSCGVIVDYNGMLKSLRSALADYAVGDGDDSGGGDGSGGEDIAGPIEEQVHALLESIEAAENHLSGLGFDPQRLSGAQGFDRIQALRDAKDAVLTSDDDCRRFEIMARQVFIRYRSVITEPSSFQYAERHDNIETIYKKLQEKHDAADITGVLKELHKIVNEAIWTQKPGEDHAVGLKIDLSKIDFQKLRDEFARKVKRKHAVLKDIRDVIEAQLAMMLARNPNRMDYYKKYQEIIAEYNREKDRATVEETFAKLAALSDSLDTEQRRAAKEGLSEDELALFDLLLKKNISKKNRERLKQASKGLLASLQELLRPMPKWAQNAQTQAEVEVFVLNNLFSALPNPPFSSDETEQLSRRVYDYIWQRNASGNAFGDRVSV